MAVILKKITKVTTETKADVAMAMVIMEAVVMDKVITEVIIITNITRMMMVHRLSSMDHHALSVEALITLLNIVLRENMTLITQWKK